MNLPTKKECYEILDSYHVPDNVIRHSKLVAKISVKIGKKFIEKGINVNLELIERAALLHDVLRTLEFCDFQGFVETLTPEQKKHIEGLKAKYDGLFHGESGGRELEDKFPEMAEVIKAHGFFSKDIKQMSVEELIVNYADKRCDDDNTVTLKQRFESGAKRWKHTANVDKAYERALLLENLILSRLRMRPEELEL